MMSVGCCYINPIALAASSRSSYNTSISRRRLLSAALACIASNGAIRIEEVFAQDGPAKLPGGAAQFSRILSARNQWVDLGVAVSGERVLEDEEWINARTYLRKFYALGEDMEYLAKPWDRKLKDRALALVKDFRKTVKGMDKPAEKKDVEAFAEMHRHTLALVDNFFAILKEASTSDIPDEL